jgi:hypothetical protein
MTNPTMITPGEVNEYLVEIYPVGNLISEIDNTPR